MTSRGHCALTVRMTGHISHSAAATERSVSDMNSFLESCEGPGSEDFIASRPHRCAIIGSNLEVSTCIHFSRRPILLVLRLFWSPSAAPRTPRSSPPSLLSPLRRTAPSMAVAQNLADNQPGNPLGGPARELSRRHQRDHRAVRRQDGPGTLRPRHGPRPELRGCAPVQTGHHPRQQHRRGYRRGRRRRSRPG